jgi:virginiamycin B lyase
MRPKVLWLLAGIGLGAALFQAGLSSPAQAQAALSGQVSSAQEGPMEGVLVSARRDGATVTTTVVSDDKGQYSFPTARLEPGKYTLAIRAAGYALDGPKAVEIPAGGNATADLKLGKTRNLASQLSNAEWLMSLPGDDKTKAFLTECTSCHTLQRVFMSSYDAEAWPDIFARMGRYSPGSTPQAPQPLLPGPRGERPRVRGDVKAAAEFLASVNMSASDTRSYELKTLPRPKGRATKVIFTEYDLPRKAAQPHDVVLDPDGHAWYSDFGNQMVGELDPKTGQVNEYPLATLKPEQPKGSLEISTDPEGNVWVAMMYQAGISKIDRKTKAVTAYPFPAEWQSTSTQASMVSPQHSNVDGKVWTNNQEMHALYRLDVKTGKYENMGEATDAGGKHISGYGMPTDQQNNVYLLEFGNTRIGKLDAMTNQAKIWNTPIVGSRPRRGRVDEQNRLWFAEYAGNGIAMFDPKTEMFKEWKLQTKWSNPYDVVRAKNGEVWTGSMITDQVSRLDPETDQIVDYLLPKSTNIRRVFVDDKASPPVLWVGSNHGASIVKVEPLD